MTSQPSDALDTLAQNYANGQAAIEELAMLKPLLALAISKLDKRQLKLSLTEQHKPHEWDLQMKREEKSGALVFRAVKA